jgi:FtsP/CotA-like multicopper oxidase with cupredoxin domain
VRPGECLRIVLRNALDGAEPADLHIHGVGLQVVGGGPAIATNAQAMTLPGGTVTYEWQAPDDEREATHYLHSHGDQRLQSEHGLFGALVVEPPDSEWIDPRSGTESRGWDAMVRAPGGPSFREFVIMYHEVGDESYQVLDSRGQFVPLVDSISQAYRPDGRALSYRSEPFLNRFRLGQLVLGHPDESLAYSSYSYGDPATPVMRTYLGDPTKQRIVHAGSEVFHVHHMHGGATRWRRQPGEEDPGLADGLVKKPELTPKLTERTDSQSLGPSETFDVVDECGAGGCQQSAGDFLYHCHIAQHYFSGMWGLWRVYNTLQDGPASTDALPKLAVLEDRAGATKTAVPAASLAGTTLASYGTKTELGAFDLAGWVERQLPPQGTPKVYDASVWDWTTDGTHWLGEAETDQVWPGYRARAPGIRPELLFDPQTGKLAYPFMRPHLAHRPPFSPNHGPDPYLDTPAVGSGTGPPEPGSSGAGSVCPAGTKQKQFDINAISTPVTMNARDNLVDSGGELFVLRQNAEAARVDRTLQVPLAIRANAGEDCVDVLLRSDLRDGGDAPFSKVGLHIHFVQFDVQASDGLDAGFNYEQTVRPFLTSAETISQPVAAGATTVEVGDATRFSVGSVVGVGVDQASTFESHRIMAIQGDVLTLDRGLTSAHGAGEVVSAEFVRYRWYPDAQFGTSYFHDHVDAIHSWYHGLLGALIAEPPGSTYTDAHTGAELRSGPIADIHTEAKVSNEITGSFRELSLFIQDDNKLNAVGRSSGSAYNLRAEPLDARNGDPSLLFSSAAHGDPETPIIEANLGDPVVVRSLVGATNDVHTVHIDGHWFRGEPWSSTSPPIDTIHLGISERYDLSLAAAGGPQKRPGDYLYYSGRTFKLEEGSWGLVRVHAADEGNLKPLPGHETTPTPSQDTCPARAPVRPFGVSVVEASLPMLQGATGKVYVLDSEADAVASGQQPPQPLVLHVGVGDCIEVALTNRTAAGDVTYHCDLLAVDPATSGGVAAGREPAQSVAPGASQTFRYYASPEVGETVSLVRDWGNVLENPGVGLYGAIVVGPPGATYRGTGWSVDVFPKDAPPYRDVSLFFQENDESIGTHRMPYTTAVKGNVGVNYRAAPLQERLAGDRWTGAAFRSDANGDPPTPLIQAFAGDGVRVHVLAPWSEQAQVFSIEGHRWPQEPGRVGTNVIGSTQVGGLEALTLDLDGGAGGIDHLPGDYVYGDHRGPYLEAGLWGIFRVHPQGQSVAGLRPLMTKESSLRLQPTVIALGALVLVVVFSVHRRRRLASSG